MSTASVTTPVGSVDREFASVRVRHWLLAALTVSSGAVDAISFLALGKIFTAFMTGNVAFLGMGAYRHAFANPKAALGEQAVRFEGARVWVLPSPSGLNASYQRGALGAALRDLHQATQA